MQKESESKGLQRLHACFRLLITAREAGGAAAIYPEAKPAAGSLAGAGSGDAGRSRTAPDAPAAGPAWQRQNTGGPRHRLGMERKGRSAVCALCPREGG